MKLNEKVKKTFQRMHCLSIPRKKRREYIKRAYDCRFLYTSPKDLNKKLDVLAEKQIYREEAVSNLDESLKTPIEEYYQRNLLP